MLLSAYIYGAVAFADVLLDRAQPQAFEVQSATRNSASTHRLFAKRGY